MRVTAAVLNAYDTPFVLEELELDEPGPGEVLVKVVASGICHTDGLAQHADLPFPVPGVLGHEGAGIVEAVGEGVTLVAPGDAVVLGWPWCGDCDNCRTGQPRYCDQLGPLLVGGGRGDGSTSLSRGGDPVHSHFFGQSSFSTYSIASESSLVKVPAGLDIDKLGPLACGISTGAGAVFNALRPGLGSSIAVYGTGAVGLAAVMAARSTGATRIIGVDLHDARLDIARELGATDVVNARTADPVEAIKDLCGGPADFAIDCTGSVTVVRQVIDSVGMLGTACLIGGAPAGATFEADHLTTLWGKRIVGTLGGESTSKRLISSLLDLHAEGRFPYDRLIVEFPFEQINEALAASYSGDVLKPVLRMPR
ncbi:MAG: NAD(P)-dependent alcohol dehydrogenase [Actinobacteria bacterium]|nr:NAD(P)-dependent alcohol dehydrogenase [Actinomycetota bacterium]MBI3686706.1 NAD(P)-dependent alcohol dehydrogenase [Actinomycetota bacterium]